MIAKPDNFDGAKFAQKYNLDPVHGFWVDAHGYLWCPSLPDLQASDLADCVFDPPGPPIPTLEERVEAAELMINLLLDTQQESA